MCPDSNSCTCGPREGSPAAGASSSASSQQEVSNTAYRMGVGCVRVSVLGAVWGVQKGVTGVHTLLGQLAAGVAICHNGGRGPTASGRPTPNSGVHELRDTHLVGPGRVPCVLQDVPVVAKRQGPIQLGFQVPPRQQVPSITGDAAVPAHCRACLWPGKRQGPARGDRGPEVLLARHQSRERRER